MAIGNKNAKFVPKQLHFVQIGNKNSNLLPKEFGFKGGRAWLGDYANCVSAARVQP